MERREVVAGMLAAAVAAAARLAGAAPESLPQSPELEAIDLNFEAHAPMPRAWLFVPRPLPARCGLLTLLHGLGETRDVRSGVGAYAERYGLLSAYERLRRPPIERTLRDVDYFGAEHLRELNEALRRRPFRGMALLCPYTPNPYRKPASFLDGLAEFLTEVVVPAAEQRSGAGGSAALRMLSGVSLGGYVALEVFCRKPEPFGAVGSVQGAFGKAQAARYGAKLAELSRLHGPRPVELSTSSGDPYRAGAEALARELAAASLPHRLVVTPGPHDQRWLRESGSIDLLWGASERFEGVEVGAR